MSDPCRLCKLLIDSSFDPSSHVSQLSHIVQGITANSSAFKSVHLPHTKTKENSDELSMTDTGCDCSPTSAFDNHLTSNQSIHPNASLFAFEMSNGGWSHMRWDWFLARCNEIWSWEGLSLIKGHGFRIGGMTHLLLLGVDLWIVMVQGRWSLQSFLGYWHKCKEILPLSIGFSFQSHESILTTMSSFKNKLLNK